jgi:hypothetical protein
LRIWTFSSLSFLAVLLVKTMDNIKAIGTTNPQIRGKKNKILSLPSYSRFLTFRPMMIVGIEQQQAKPTATQERMKVRLPALCVSLDFPNCNLLTIDKKFFLL